MYDEFIKPLIKNEKIIIGIYFCIYNFNNLFGKYTNNILLISILTNRKLIIH